MNILIIPIHFNLGAIRSLCFIFSVLGGNGRVLEVETKRKVLLTSKMRVVSGLLNFLLFQNNPQCQSSVSLGKMYMVRTKP